MEGQSESGKESEEKNETIGQMKQRHYKELREHQNASKARLQSIKKKDKEKKEAKKRIKEESRIQEREIRERHAAELAAIQMVNEQIQITEAMAELKTTHEQKQSKAKKAQKKRSAAKAVEEKRRLEAEEEAKNMVNPRALELEKFRKQLAPLALEIKEMISDGNCLYRAIHDQLFNLDIEEAQLDVANSVMRLRALASNYMLEHPSDFMPYIANEEAEFKQYCEAIIDPTRTEWGGQVEISALAHALNHPIMIYLADSNPLILGDTLHEQEQITPQPLRISYHAHYFSLGKHYNSVVSTAR